MAGYEYAAQKIRDARLGELGHNTGSGSTNSDAELLAWYREIYPTMERNATIGWTEAARLRRERNTWRAIAVAAWGLTALLAGGFAVLWRIW